MVGCLTRHWRMESWAGGSANPEEARGAAGREAKAEVHTVRGAKH